MATIYFLQQTGSTMIDGAMETMKPTGRPSSGLNLSMTVGVNGSLPACGSYQSGASLSFGGNSPSAVFLNGASLAAVDLVITHASDYRNDRLQPVSWLGAAATMAADKPSPRTSISNVQVFKENATYDSGLCQETINSSPIVFQKFSGEI